MICDHCKGDDYGCRLCGEVDFPTVLSKAALEAGHRTDDRHPKCKGCTCQHKPPGSWNGGRD